MSTLNKSAAVATIIGTVIALVALICQLNSGDPSVVPVALAATESIPASEDNLDSKPNPIVKNDSASEEVLPKVGEDRSTSEFESRIEAAMLMDIYSNKARALQGVIPPKTSRAQK